MEDLIEDKHPFTLSVVVHKVLIFNLEKASFRNPAQTFFYPSIQLLSYLELKNIVAAEQQIIH